MFFQNLLIAAGVAYLVGYVVTVAAAAWVGRHAGPLVIPAAMRVAVRWPLVWLERWLNARDDRLAARG